MNLDYEQDIRIDESALDIECLNQPELTMKYARHAAEMEKKRDEAKEKLNYLKSEIDKEIRKDPSEFDLDKLTEPLIASTILLDERYRKANQELIEAQHNLNIARGATFALSDRKSMLETLVKLHGQQYFAGPKVARDILEERSKLRTESGISNNLNNRKRRTK